MSSVNLNMLHSLKPFQCPSCNSTYSSKEAARYNVTRFPRILTCSHSACENCLNTATKDGSFSCPTCKETIDISDNAGGISKLHPDVHALGILCANMKDSLPSIKTRLTSCALKRNQSQESLKKSVSTLTCEHCHKNEAFWQCDECQINFCSICYRDVHGDMKSKKKHEGKKIFAEPYNCMVQEGCLEHENKAVEFYCEVDDQLTCSYCMLMGDHVGHEVKTLLDKNKSCANELKSVLDEVTKMQRQLQYTDHLLCKEIPKETIDTTYYVKDIHDYFHKLHALLQIRESELINELTEISESNTKFMIELRLKVTGFERDLATGKKDAESVINNPCLAISAPALLKKLKDCKNLPCHLVPVSECDTRFSNIDLELNPELEKRVKEFGKLVYNIKPKYTLMAESELPESFPRPEIPDNFDLKTLDSESCATSVDVDNFSEDSLSVDSNFSSIQATLKCKDFTRMQPEKVTVTHIKSPSSFFIQKFSESNHLLNISGAINRYCNHHDRKRSTPAELIPGDLYLVKFSGDNRWYRGRVKTILDPTQMTEDGVILGKKVPMVTDGGKVVVKNKEIRAEVFYIDYGNSETVSIYNIRNIIPRFLNAPSMAKECSLVDVNPIDSMDWSEECITTFGKLVGNKVVVMQVYEERNNVYYVDLCQAADNEISCDAPVSVRDALVFSELAVFPAGVHSLSATKKNKSKKKFMPPESLRVNANIWAIASHVEDPYNIYIQQMSTASYLSNMIFEMNETYNKEANPMLHSIYVPYVGLICAAQFSLDKQWYRAEVIGLPGGAKVEVRYVDFGNKEIIHHKYLRKLFDKFVKLNIQAIPCKLAHVSYNQEKNWCAEAKKWLTNEVSRKQLTIKSLGAIPGSHKSEVVLYYSDDLFDICVNSRMVQEGFATATGQFGSSDVKILKEIPPPKEITNSKDVSPVPRQVSDEIIPPPKAFNKVKTKTPPRMEKVPSPIKMATPNKKYPSLATPANQNDSQLIEVHVSHVESPGCFYIRAAGDIEKKLILLMEELQKTYENLDTEMIDFTVGKAYAVFSRNQKKWFRGTILSTVSEDKVKVRFDDYANIEDINTRDIRKLLDKFTKDDAFSIRCHLAGMIPPGGSSQWPGTTCDAFLRGVETAKNEDKVILSSKGDPEGENNSLPADLLIENLVRGGALEPTKLEYISITEELLKNGLALPLRKRNGTPSGMQFKNISETNSESRSWADKVEKVEKEAELEAKEVVCVPNNKGNCVEEGCDSTPEIKPPKPALPKFQWKPAVLPIESPFKGFVTNIGEDGTIHLYSLSQGAGQVNTIKKALQFRFSKNGNYEPLKNPPPIGEACIAKFSVDDMWYRAEVLKSYPGQIKVNFVDYGNNEIVPLKDLRLDVIMQSFPRQCIECGLFGLNDIIKWDDDLTTFLHNQLVETEVDVEIKGPSENGRLPCQIKMQSGIDIADLLLSMGFDTPDQEDVNLLSVSQTDLDSFKTFTTPRELREGDIFPVCVTQVPSPNIVYLQKLKISNPKDDYEQELNEQHELFLQLIADLRQKADEFPKLIEPLPGMPCCAKYSYDKNWYRCEVMDLTPDGVVVLFVDYGNTETVSADDLRELEKSFIDFPVQVYFCELHGMKSIGPDWDPSVHEKISSKLLTDDQHFVARVVVPGKISQIDILTEINGQYQLVYEDLVKDNLIILEK